MDFCFLNDYEGEKEMLVEDEYILFKYKYEGEDRELKIDYIDVVNVDLFRFRDVYLLTIETRTMSVDLNIDLNDEDKLDKCKKLYRKVTSSLCENYSKDDLYTEYRSDEYLGYNIMLNMEEHYDTAIKSLKKLLGVLVVILIATIVLR